MKSKLVCFESDSQSIDNVQYKRKKEEKYEQIALDQLINEQALRKYLIH